MSIIFHSWPVGLLATSGTTFPILISCSSPNHLSRANERTIHPSIYPSIHSFILATTAVRSFSLTVCVCYYDIHFFKSPCAETFGGIVLVPREHEAIEEYYCCCCCCGGGARPPLTVVVHHPYSWLGPSGGVYYWWSWS